MLVYANHLSFQGAEAETAVFKAVGGWLKEQLGFGLHPDQLKRDGEYDGYRGAVRSWLHVYATDGDEPRLYAWVLRFADENVYGRQWIVEAGVKAFGQTLELSCVVKTDESSTLVAEPVTASQPRLIRYVINNIRQSTGASLSGAVAGVDIKRVGESVDSYRALLAEIERPERAFPIVLVSPTRDGEYLVAAQDLQERLIGLAQVVEVSRDSNSYDMADVLGQQRSAWGGAINVLQTPSRTGFVRARYFLADVIEGWGNAHDRYAQILAWVTSNTNMLHLRQHVRPEGVMQLALRRKMQTARAQSERMDAAELRQALEEASQQAVEQAKFFDELVDENSRLETSVSELKDELEDALDEIGRKEFNIQALKDQLARAGGGRTGAIDVATLLDLACRTDCPTPLECVNLIESLYGDRCVVLESAKGSAREMNRFVYGRQLLDMLKRLVTEYRDKLSEGGDNAARQVFGKNEYSAKESETVMSNKAMRRERTFDYDGEEVEMFRHLKIGVADDETKTIRVHFHWDAERKKIVIGYCGGHLTISSR